MVDKSTEFDAGGSPAKPYYGEDGRAEATRQAREDNDDRGNTIRVEDRNTGVTGSTVRRERDEDGREVIPAQVTGVENVGVEAGGPEEAAAFAESRADVPIASSGAVVEGERSESETVTSEDESPTERGTTDEPDTTEDDEETSTDEEGA